MLIFTYIALANWLIIALIAVMITFGLSIVTRTMASVGALLVSVLFVWLAYVNILEVSKCRELMQQT